MFRLLFHVRGSEFLGMNGMKRIDWPFRRIRIQYDKSFPQIPDSYDGR
jgi:hypothetical protein